MHLPIITSLPSQFSILDTRSCSIRAHLSIVSITSEHIIVEARSSPSDESCFSTRKKAVACPTSGAPGTPCVSRVAVSDCIVPLCPIVDLPGRTRTPNVTDKNNTRAGSREHSQGGTDTVSGPSSMQTPREAFDRRRRPALASRLEHIS